MTKPQIQTRLDALNLFLQKACHIVRLHVLTSTFFLQLIKVDFPETYARQLVAANIIEILTACDSFLSCEFITFVRLRPER